MDREERDRLKQEKLKIVRQKIFRREIIKSLDSKFANKFEELDYILTPEIDAIIRKIEEKSVIVILFLIGWIGVICIKKSAG